MRMSAEGLPGIPSGPGSRLSWSHRAAVVGHLAITLIIATILRVRDLDRYSLWYDEAVTMRLARTKSPSELVALLGQIDGTRAPLHPLILQGWLRLFGTSELAGRSFSTLCGILTVAAVYVLGRRLLDEQAGRWAAWFAAVCPPLVYYSQEARMYALLVLLTCLSWLVFAESRRRAGTPAKAAYWLLLTGLVYSHPLGLFMVAAHGLAYLVIRRSLTLGFRSWLLIQLAVLLATLPWIPRYLDHGTDYPLPRYSPRFLLAIPIEYIGGNALVLLACTLVIAVGLFSAEGRGCRLARPAENLLLIAWLTVPPVLMYTYSRVGQPIFGPPRYHLFIAPAYLLLLAQGLCRFRPPIRWALAAGALCLSLVAIDANVYSQVVKADWRGLARWLDHGQSQGEATTPAGPITLVVHPSDPRFPSAQIGAAQYYLDPPHRVILPDAESSAGGEPTAGRATLDVYCLSAEQVRAGTRDLRDTDLPATVWQRTGTDFHHGMPEFYGLVIRRR